jgi:hypothetical protein
MARQSTRAPGETIGGWRLSRYLGGGSNAEVWEATRSNAEKAALKILYQKNAPA